MWTAAARPLGAVLEPRLPQWGWSRKDLPSLVYTILNWKFLKIVYKKAKTIIFIHLTRDFLQNS